MRIAAFTDALGQPFEEALDALAALGLTTVDLRSRIGDHTIDTLNEEAAQQVQQALRSRNLTADCLASPAINPPGSDYVPDRAHRRAAREKMVALANLAEMLDAASICVYSFRQPYDRITGNHRADNAAFLADLAEICWRRNKPLLVRNHPRTLTATYADLADLMGRCIPPNLRLCWDVVAGVEAGQPAGVEGPLESVAGSVAQVVIATNEAGVAALRRKSIFRRLLAAGFNGTVVIDAIGGATTGDLPGTSIEQVGKTFGDLKARLGGPDGDPGAQSP